MTLETKHGGPVFDGLWIEVGYGKTWSYLKYNGVFSGAWSGRFLFRSLSFPGHEDYVEIYTDLKVAYCLAPINLIKWSDSDDS